MASDPARLAPLDPDLQAVLAANPNLSVSLLPRHIPRLRQMQTEPGRRASAEILRCGGRVDFEELSIPSSQPGVNLPLLLLRKRGADKRRPGLCFFHGGGMVAGDERTGIEAVLEWVHALGLVVASPAYRLAPEHPHPAPVEDCYATLRWMHQQRAALGLDDQPLIVAGLSAGGGLAAGVALLARARGGPAIGEQVLMYPMLDDRAAFASSRALKGQGVWDARSNQTGWEALLGATKGEPCVPSCAAPSRETDLSALPAAYLDVGAVETFRDEVIDYGARLAQAGVSAELHVWAGAFHGFDLLAPRSAVAMAARAARLDYLCRRLGARVRP